MMKMQVPINRELKESWDEYVSEHGFDSIQSYIRFIAKANVDGRKVNLDEGIQLSPEAIQRYNEMIDEIDENPDKHLSKSYEDVDSMFDDLESDLPA